MLQGYKQGQEEETRERIVAALQARYWLERYSVGDVSFNDEI